LMRSCYNVDAIDASFDLHTPSDQNGVPYPRLSLSLGTASNPNECDTHLSNSTLQDGVFKCSALPECDMQCHDLSDADGRDNSALFSFSLGAACTAEWYCHAFLLRVVFTFVIYLCINFARVVFVSGVTRIAWKKLNTGYFAYRATCQRNGSHTYEREKLADKVEAMLSTMQLKGAVFIAIAFGLQLPWIIALNEFVTNLVYGSA